MPWGWKAERRSRDRPEPIKLARECMIRECMMYCFCDYARGRNLP